MGSNSAKTPKKHPAEESKLSENSDFRAEIEKSRAMIEGADKEPAPKKIGRPSNAERQAQEDALKAARIADLERLAPPASLKAMIALPFDLAAMKTGFAGFQLTPEEAEAIAPSLHEVMIAYAPAVTGPHVALLALAGALFSIGIGKYVAFLHAATEGHSSQAAEAESPPAAAPAPKDGGTFFPPGMHIT